MLILLDDGGHPIGPTVHALTKGSGLVSLFLTGLASAVSIYGVKHSVDVLYQVQKRKVEAERIREKLESAVAQHHGVSPPKVSATVTSMHASAVEEQPLARTGYSLLITLAWIAFVALVVILLSIAYLRRAEIVANPHAALRVTLAVLMMAFGIAADIMLTFQTEGRDLQTIQVSEVLYPLMFSVVVFYGVYPRLIEGSGDLAAAYNAFTSGFLWRRFVSVVQNAKKN